MDAENKGEILIYRSEDGLTHINVKMKDETVWLTQQQMAELFQTSRTNVVEHIQHIYEENELDEISTCRKFRQLRKEGTRDVNRNIPYYNLDMIISLGYRIKSSIATNFRRWATERLKEYIIKGFTMDDAEKPYMGLTSFSGDYPLAKDICNAKNYLQEDELKILNNLVSGYFDFAEVQAMRRNPMYMNDYIEHLDNVLSSTGEKLLVSSGKVSHTQALEKAKEEYRKYQTIEITPVEQAYLDTIKDLEKTAKKTLKCK